MPTLFTHNADKQPAKRQHCQDAFLHSAQVERFEFEYNTKETQNERVVLLLLTLPSKGHNEL